MLSTWGGVWRRWCGNVYLLNLGSRIRSPVWGTLMVCGRVIEPPWNLRVVGLRSEVLT